jgi:hypothetical protein
LVVLKFELLGKCSTTWSISPALFALVVFQIMYKCFFVQASLGLWSSYLCLLYSWNYSVNQNALPLCWTGPHWLFAKSDLESQSSWSLSPE